jgi:hypothetical protein
MKPPVITLIRGEHFVVAEFLLPQYRKTFFEALSALKKANKYIHVFSEDI